MLLHRHIHELTRISNIIGESGKNMHLNFVSY